MFADFSDLSHLFKKKKKKNRERVNGERFYRLYISLELFSQNGSLDIEENIVKLSTTQLSNMFILPCSWYLHAILKNFTYRPLVTYILVIYLFW